MRLHLPVSLRKSLLSCLVASIAATFNCSTVWASSESAPQNLIFEGDRLTWNTNANNKAFTNAAGEAASFATGDNVSFASDATISLGEDISAGQINIASGADAVIELNDNGLNFDTLSMLGGSLDVGNSLNVSSGETLAVGSNNSVLKSALVLESDACLSVDYSGSGSATSLNNSSLSLQGDTQLQLSGCGNGDGKTYTLLTGVSELKDTQGNAISLNSTNNAIAKYFDTSQPGTGFWADATLQLSADGILRLVRHSEAVNAAVTISTRWSGSVDYQYYEGVHFADIEYTTDSSVAYGGAIYGERYSTITLSDNGSVSFIGNTASSSDSSAFGGAIYGASSSTITLSDNGIVSFIGNTASSSDSYYAFGGAIYGASSSTITLSNNGSVVFSGNTASGSSYYVIGGAIYGERYSTITLSNNGSVTFSGNTASGSSYVVGGAIYGDLDSTITLSDNGSVVFEGNTASGNGGAIYGASSSTITLSNNGSVEFIGNTASSSDSYDLGGAIYGSVGSMITLSNNGSVTFSGNTSSARGGAIYGATSSTITLSNNGSVEFIGNTASGGTIGGGYGSMITLSNNGSVEFSGNTTSGPGGAIHVDSHGKLILEGNDSIVFEDNNKSAGYFDGGGALYLYHVEAEAKIVNNGSVLFSRNSAAGNGGAICMYNDSALIIANNDDVIFEKNAEIEAGVYRLRSIYALGDSSVSLSAAAGKSITFYDSVLIGPGATVNLNQDYTYQAEDGTSFSIKQQGDIIFTGATTIGDLYKVKGDVDGTEAEILASRTSEVCTMTHLYGGKLRVEDGAIYKGYGITAHEGSDATVRVKDAMLNHTGYELHFYEGTKLEALGESEIFGDVIVESTATAAFSALTRLEGSLTLASGSTLLLEGALTLDGALVLGTSLTLGGNMLEMVNLLQAGQSLTLMSGLDSLAVQTGESEYTTIASGQELLAADYFSNLDSGKELVFVYNGEAGSLSMMRVIPEPATATLSLLALTALMSRRRRK